MKTRILIVRHGETEWNSQHRLQGQIDIPLSPLGRTQAKKLSPILKTFPIDIVYTSQLSRAIETAELATENRWNILKDEKLNERSYGDFEGKYWDEIEKDYKAGSINDLAHIPNGESRDAFHKRVVETFTTIIEKENGKTILFVTHGGVIRALFRHLRKIPYESDIQLHVPNTALSVLTFDADKVIEELIADISHLKNIL